MRIGALNIAIKAARQAGNIIIRNQHKVDTLSVVEKERMDYASEIDRMAEAEIFRELKKAFPDHALVGEESGAIGKSKYTWLIDPLDGTHNYLRGFPHFCVSIALLENNKPMVAVVFDPLRNELFTAMKGSGTQLNERRLRVTARAGLQGALLATGFPFRQRKHLDAQLAMTHSLLQSAEDIRRTGSAALDLCYVAAGRLDGYFEIGLKPWDMAAGALIVQEAGGMVGDFTGGSKHFESGNTVAASPMVYQGMIQAIKAHASKIK